MESYLMMLYVTLDQESALKSFFIDQGWDFLKPDLSVITDKLGPCISTSKKTSTPSETVTNIPQNTTVSPGKREPKPRNSRKRISILNQIKQPVAKLPRNKIQPSSTSGSSDLPDKGQQEPLVQIDNAKYEPVFIDDANHIIVKEEAVDSDYEQDNDDVDDNENTDIDESFKQTSADNDASGSHDVTEKDGEQDDETGGETEEGPKQPKAGATSQSADAGFTCDICSKQLSLAADLQRHKAMFHSPYSCKVCGQSFTQKTMLESHMIEEHGASLPFMCTACGTFFSQKKNLRRHQRCCEVIREFTKEPLPVCNECGKSFKSRESLRYHIKYVHTPGAEHVCDLCGNCFTRPFSLTRHRQRKHAAYLSSLGQTENST